MSFLDDIGLGGETDAEKRAKQNGQILYNTGDGTDDVSRAPTDESAYEGTPYARHGFNEVWDGASGQRDQRDFLYGRDPLYASNVRDRNLARGAANQAELEDLGRGQLNDARRFGEDQRAYGERQAANIQSYAQGAREYGDAAAAYGVEASGRHAPTLDVRQQNQSLGIASENAHDLRALEANEGPSAAQAQLQSGLNSATAANTSLARGGRGFGGGASALRAAISQNANMAQNASLASAQLRAQENAQWRSRQAANMASAANINQNVAAQFGTQSQVNAENELRNRQVNDAAAYAGYGAGLTGQNTGANITATGANTGMAGMRDQASTTANGYSGAANTISAGMNQAWQGEAGAADAMKQQNSNDQAYENMLTQEKGIRDGLEIEGYKRDQANTNAELAFAGALMAASDERGKVKLSSAVYGNPYGRSGSPFSKKKVDSEVDPDFRGVKNEVYAYKNPAKPGARPGPQVGLMAQDLERVLPSAVVDTPTGKMVDTSRMSLALPGAIGRLQERVDQLENETTHLDDSDEKKFLSWAREHNVRDVDHPESHYDYRGYWREHAGDSVRGGVDHFPDTYKQHGHPTFSTESRYSRGPGDGGNWLGDDYFPGVPNAYGPAATAGLPRRDVDYDSLDAAYASSDERGKEKLSAKNYGFGYGEYYRDTSPSNERIDTRKSHREESAEERNSKRFDELEAVSDSAKPIPETSPVKAFARNAVAHAFDTAALPVTLAGEGLEAIGYPNKAAHLDANTALEGIDYLSDPKGHDPSEYRRYVREERTQNPYATAAGGMLGDAVGGAALGGAIESGAGTIARVAPKSWAEVRPIIADAAPKKLSAREALHARRIEEAAKYLEAHPDVADLHGYTGSDYRAINEVLRNDAGVGSSTYNEAQRAKIRAQSERLKAILEGAETGGHVLPGKVTRGLDIPEETLRDWLDKGAIENRSFWSTSTKPNIADLFTGTEDGMRKVVLNIKQKSGVPVSGVSGVMKESEVLLAPGKKWEIRGSRVDPDTGKTVLDLVQVDKFKPGVTPALSLKGEAGAEARGKLRGITRERADDREQAYGLR